MSSALEMFGPSIVDVGSGYTQVYMRLGYARVRGVARHPTTRQHPTFVAKGQMRVYIFGVWGRVRTDMLLQKVDFVAGSGPHPGWCYIILVVTFALRTVECSGIGPCPALNHCS